MDSNFLLFPSKRATVSWVSRLESDSRRASNFFFLSSVAIKNRVKLYKLLRPQIYLTLLGVIQTGNLSLEELEDCGSCGKTNKNRIYSSRVIGPSLNACLQLDLPLLLRGSVFSDRPNKLVSEQWSDLPSLQF